MEKFKPTLNIMSIVAIALFTISCGVDKQSNRTDETLSSLDANSTNLVSPLQITHNTLILFTTKPAKQLTDTPI